ncbi:MAG: lauroyl acyltransferase [Azospira oryzae]|nr:MAG: lauroyl acyltransferase [Azospira oryzae]
MNEYAVYALGFFAQSLFGSRLVIQWIQSERKGKVVSPTIFWILSLMASFLFLLYGVLRRDPVILIGQTFSYYIYIRNLQLKGFWKRIPLLLRVIITPQPILILTWIAFMEPEIFAAILDKSDFTEAIMIIGTIGQLMLNLRYLYQWYYSEKAKESLLPLGFWVISFVASIMVVSYAYIKMDPVLLVSQGLGMLSYSRNIYLSARALKREQENKIV